MKKIKIITSLIGLSSIIFASQANAAITVNSTGFTGTSALTIQPASPATIVGSDSLLKIYGVENNALSTEPIEIRAYDFGNMGMGFESLKNLDGGTENTAFGYNALKAHDSGDDNSAFGIFALTSNVYGDRNTAFGGYSLYTTQGGNSNTAVGYQAMYGTTDGDENTAVGYGAMGSNQTGDNNIALGTYAGSNITSGSNNIVIGYNIYAPSATTSNQMSIGNIIFGTSLNATGTSIPSSGKVGIAVSAPTSLLSNYGSNISDAAGFGLLSAQAFSWSVSGFGYAAAIENRENTDTQRNGLLVKTANAATNNYIAKFESNGTNRLTIRADGNVGVGTSAPTEVLDVNADNIRIRTSKTPASSSAACDQGEVSWDSSYIYICTATNTWKRAAIATW